MRYCDYSFYKDNYSGTMPESVFNRLSVIASAKIKSNTSGRIVETNISEEVKYCTCSIADKIKELEKAEGKKSESIGTWSITYEDSKENEAKLYKIMKDYLSESQDQYGTPLLYRGC